VARVRTSSHSKKFLRLPYFQGTPILFVSFNYRIGPLGFPQGPEVAKRGALNLGLHDQWVALQWVKNNVALFGGDPCKVCPRLCSLSRAGMIPQTLIGHSRWTNCWSNIHLLSLPERGLFDCCPSCCTRLSLTGRRGASSHNGPFYRSSNQERHSLFPILMPAVIHPPGCSSQITYHPVPQHQ
jgi:hypothetical protein